MRTWIAIGLLLAGAEAGATTFAGAAWPDLTAEALNQVATAVDGARPDEPALYPLLLNLRGWGADGVARAQAAVLSRDWERLLQEPGRWRAAPMVLEGRFAGRVREVGLLRGGPWGRTVTEWGLVADGPKGAAGRVAVVLFPWAPGEVARPRDRQRVRVVGRFFKTWTDADAAGRETTYPVFVAARDWDAAGPAGGGVGAAGRWRLMGGVVLVLGAGLWVLRRALRAGRQSEKRKAKSEKRRHALGAADGVEVEEPALPEDPAEALAELSERAKRV